MRAVNTFCIIVFAFALVATAVHMTVERAIKKAGGLHLPLGDVTPPPCLPPPDNIVKLAGNELWIEAARKAAHEIATIKGEVSADDVWAACPPPEGMNRKLMMAAFPRHEWEKIGLKRSERRECHNREVAVWRRKGDV
jgi:hypothetical protein